MDKTLVGLDVGRKRTKAVALLRGTDIPVRADWATLIGSVPRSSFKGIGDASVTLGNGRGTILVEHDRVSSEPMLVGEDVLQQSTVHRSARGRSQSDEDLLVHLAYTCHVLGAGGEVVLCTGTPAALYDAQKDRLRELFCTEFIVNRRRVEVTECHVLPQPAGSGWLLIMDEGGRFRPKTRRFAEGPFAIMDVGWYSSDGIVLTRMQSAAARTVTVEMGMGTVYQAVADYLTGLGYPRRAYEVESLIKARQVTLDGIGPVDLEPVIRSSVNDVGKALAEEFEDVWTDRPEYTSFVLTGGGTWLLSDFFKARWGSRVEPLPLPAWNVAFRPDLYNACGFLAYLWWLNRAG